MFGVDIEWVAERSFAHRMGYGGKTDLLGYEYIDGPDARPTPTILIDFKSKDGWDPAKPPATYDEHYWQLAAYRYGLGAFDATCAIVFVSREEPWQVSIAPLDADKLDRGWRCFVALREFWIAKNNFDPSWEEFPDGIPF